MKLRDAIAQIDRSDDNNSYLSEQFYDAMGFPNGRYHENSKKVEEIIQSYWLIRRYCTDTWVGARVYFFNDEPLAVSIQSARKNGEDFNFVSKEMFLAAHEAISKLMVESPPECDLANLDEEIGDSYQIEFYDGVIDDEALYEGEEVKILRKETAMARSKLTGLDQYLYKKAVIQMASGETKEVPLTELHFPFRLAK